MAHPSVFARASVFTGSHFDYRDVSPPDISGVGEGRKRNVPFLSSSLPSSFYFVLPSLFSWFTQESKASSVFTSVSNLIALNRILNPQNIYQVKVKYTKIYTRAQRLRAEKRIEIRGERRWPTKPNAAGDFGHSDLLGL